MKRVVTIYHPKVNHEMQKLILLKHSHGLTYSSTFSILNQICKKHLQTQFEIQIDLSDLKISKAKLRYKNGKFFFVVDNFTSVSKPEIWIKGRALGELIKINNFRIFLHRMEECIMAAAKTQFIFETTSFVQPAGDVYTILLHDTDKKNLLNSASLFINYSNEDLLGSILNFIFEPKYEPILQFETINYDVFFRTVKKNKNIELIRPIAQSLINDLRRTKNFDSFDVEIQTLAASTLYDPRDLLSNKSSIKKIVNEELLVIEKRYQSFRGIIPVNELLTPQGIFKGKTRYWFDNKRTFAVPINKQGIDKSLAMEVEFKLVEKELAVDFTECFHYIHNRHDFDYAFGFFVKGERFPYAISLVEYVGDRLYKTEFLHQVGINPSRTLDEIRLYSLPWCPMTTSSVLSYKVREFIKENLPNITHTITAVNKNIFSGTYIHQAGYMPLALKPTKFGFKELSCSGITIPYYNGSDPNLPRHSLQKLLPTVEYYRPVRCPMTINKGENLVFNISYEQYQENTENNI
ncbi:hypothetical protein COU89_00285 [Candidatus Roizmanbacteria bacterium CG10_big_fil_rev_8_21_14_0_10_45_7]|uniref:Uncharacterized protein n=1 Tax=Candidatus Roizmanbacteria bacterium CG10_big_fil_rev_8_21_14_0_10_45_7 TaxID=1974854 RepID=A0A2M8KVN8_9BACT|nr:MAG: hypothetical protein COU89_00285 [Candidatus Roizmanbacteria bacterium CG10_big_fil_rev_8_21_14_0_10_45_7]